MLPTVEAFGLKGPVELRPQIFKPVTHLERLWAYLTVKQLLGARELAQNKTRLEKEALALSLKYSFVTPVSSLVVVKPNSTSSAVETVRADKPLLPLPVGLSPNSGHVSKYAIQLFSYGLWEVCSAIFRFHSSQGRSHYSSDVW